MCKIEKKDTSKRQTVTRSFGLNLDNRGQTILKFSWQYGPTCISYTHHTYLTRTAHGAWCERARSLLDRRITALREATWVPAILLPATVTLLALLHHAVATQRDLRFCNKQCGHRRIRATRRNKTQEKQMERASSIPYCHPVCKTDQWNIPSASEPCCWAQGLWRSGCTGWSGCYCACRRW